MKKEMWLIWKHPESRRRYKVGTLVYEDDTYTFQYVNPELDDALKVGFHYFPGFEDLHKVYTASQLFANIETRLPNSSRKDYLELLNLYNLERNCTKLEILKATKGRLITDNYEFVAAFDSSKIEFDVAGVRHYLNKEQCQNLLELNDKLLLELDPVNQYDDYAIKVICSKNGNRYHLGYVPRYYSKELANLLQKKVSYSAMIKGFNFESEIDDENITAFVNLIFNE